MYFKRTQSATFTTLVTVNIPNEKGGFDKNGFTARFKRTTNDETNALRTLKNEEVVRQILVGWDLKDADTKEDVPFSEAELNAILLIDPSALAIAQAFFESVNGARTKN